MRQLSYVVLLYSTRDNYLTLSYYIAQYNRGQRDDAPRCVGRRGRGGADVDGAACEGTLAWTGRPAGWPVGCQAWPLGCQSLDCPRALPLG